MASYCIRLLLLICSFLSYSSLSFADDSEIFFSKDLSTTKPNIIFLLDLSGSMSWDVDKDSPTKNVESRLDILKDSLHQILGDPSVTNIRAGVMTFSNNTSQLQEVVDIEQVNPEKDITKTPVGTDKTRLLQEILSGADDGYEGSSSVIRPVYTARNYTLNKGRTFGYRFNNILLKNPSTVGITTPNNEISSAILKLYTATAAERTITIYIDAADSAPYFTEAWNFLSKRITGNPISCTSPARTTYFECDVTDFVSQKISQPGWENGNAIAFYVTSTTSSLYLSFQEETIEARRPVLTIEADNRLIANNKITYRDELLTKIFSLTATGGTAIVGAMLDVAQYVSNVPQKPNPGPYHNKNWGESPLQEGCQLTHMVVMTDGDAGTAAHGRVAPYIGQSTNACKIFIDSEGTTILENSPRTAERCGRALTSWMARKNQSNFSGENYIRTQSIGFALKKGSYAQNFVEDIAAYGMGKSYNANNATELTAAFKDIINTALVVDSPSASGSITLSPQSRYKQRKEVYYALYKSENYNYWPGNMKGFQLEYVDTTLTDGSSGKRAILHDKNGKPAMEKDGTIKETASSFWSKSIADGGKVDKGGTVAMLLDPDDRNLFTIKDGVHEKLSANANLTNSDLGLTGNNQDNVRKSLLNFITGYTYGIESPLEVETRKIGDSARSAVTLATYGCNTITSQSSILDCDKGELSQVALLASNDGFIRGYNVNNGIAIYEYMPKEMLPLIKGLHARAPLTIKETRLYGLDSNIVIYHDDKNDDGYINNNEVAYAYVMSGRGGAYLYALNISNKNNPRLEWQITNETAGFEKLGTTWSTPIVGNIKINGAITPVLIFGGGYDKSQDDSPKRKVDDVGNALYIVNAKTGNLIWSTSKNMLYSMPSPVAIITDDSTDNLVTDIIVGDMGGQIWRFQVNNTNQANQLISPVGNKNGIIAVLADDTLENSRRFYHAPVIYKFEDKNSNLSKIITVNIGSGYRAHPLSTETQDRIYSLRFPKTPDSGNQKILTDNDLAIASSDGQTLLNDHNLDNGFVIKLSHGTGEKVISDGLADFDRLVFNTYIPTKVVTTNCTPGTGTQRTYSFNIKSGISLLQTAYIENSISALPPDVTTYCDNSYCTIVFNPSQLSEDSPLYIGKDGVDPFIVKTDGGEYIRTSWTDIFNISSK